MTRIFGITGWSGAGKTTMIRRLLPRLVDDGLTASTTKHAHRGFDIDQAEKDSWHHREPARIRSWSRPRTVGC